MIIIIIVNPFSGAVVEHDITDLSQDQLDAYAQVMDPDTLYDMESVGADTPEEWLSRWVDLVGPEEAGRIILGS